MPAESVGAEISQLMRRGPRRGPQRGRKYGRQQAIAAALNMARSGAFGPRAAKGARVLQRRRGRA